MNIIDYVGNHLTEVDFSTITTVTPKSCNSFDELMNRWKEGMSVTQSLMDCAALCFAIHVSTKLDGDPLWSYLVGAPSSGKSTLCELICADEFNTKPLSKFTGLVSGSREGNHLVPAMQNKCVVIKDGTLLLESTPQQLANVYGELRDIFDGSLEAHYRNGVEASFKNISFSMIIGITERVYALNMSALGERFLHIRLETTRETEQSRNRNAIDSIFQDTKITVAEGNEEGDSRSFPLQRQFTAGFLAHLHARLRNEDILRPSYTEQDKLLIQAVADVIACSRASAPKDFKDEILYESRPEASTRVVKQIARVALGLCYVLGTKSITPEIRRLLVKMCHDTAFGRKFRIIRLIAIHEGISRAWMATKLDIPLQSCTNVLKDLMSMQVLEERAEETRKGPGRKNKLLFCPDWIRDSFRTVENASKNADNEDPVKKKATKRKPVKKKRPIKKKSPSPNQR